VTTAITTVDTRTDLTGHTTDTLLDRLHACTGWQHSITVGLNSDSPMAVFRRVEGPFAGYTLNVPTHDNDPLWLAQTVEILDGIDAGRMPTCGLNRETLIASVDAIHDILRPGRTGAATPAEVVALLGVMNPWYIDDADARQILRAICNGRPLDTLAPQSVTALHVLTAHLASLNPIDDGFADRVVDGHGIQRITVTTGGHTRQVVYPGTIEQALAYIERQATPITDDEEADIEATLNALAATLTN
jgi:hypothetical protein